ncbi:MAG: hypothetical protein IIT56_00970 [Bacteroidales bacterium]|nr:hypothetical protein [Bacteroidales bacterium]
MRLRKSSFGKRKIRNLESQLSDCLNAKVKQRGQS